MRCCLWKNGVLEDKLNNISGVVYGLVRVSVFCCVPNSTILIRIAGISSHTSPDPSRVSTRTNLHSCMWTSANQVPSLLFSSVQFSSVAQLCPTLCDSMNCSTPGLPVYHQLPEFIQTNVHRVGDAIKPSHSLSSLSPPAPTPSQHQSLFQ